MKIKKLLKNGLSLFLTFIVMSSILDFVRRPVVPEAALFLGNLVRLLSLYFASN